MTGFSYVAATREGQRLAGTLEATSADEARSRLQRDGLYLIALGEAPASVGSILPRLTLPTRTRPLTAEFIRELHTLLAAGFSLDRSLALLATFFEDSDFVGVVERVRARVREGSPLSAALGENPRYFPDSYVRMMTAGEEAGALPEVLGRLATQLDWQEEIRGRLVTALMYPAVITLVGTATVVVLLLAVLPKFVGVLEDAGQALPASTALLVTLGDFVGRFWWLLAAIVTGSAGSAWRYGRTAAGRRTIDTWDLRAPVWGPLRRQLLVAQFSRMFAVMLRSGVSLVPALRTAAGTIRNTVLRAGLHRAMDEVRKGRSLSETIGESSLFPPLAVRMMHLGEESGELEHMLETIAETFERRARERIDRLVGLVEPMLILLFAMVVGFLALAIFQAIYGLNEVTL